MMRALNFTIEPFRGKRADLDAVATLAERTFGRGYFETGIADAFERYPSTVTLLLAREPDPGKLLGFGLSYMLPRNGLVAFLHGPALGGSGLEGVLRPSDEAGTIGVIQTICVVEELRGCGLARALTREAEIGLARYGPSDFLMPAWSFDNRAPAGRMLDALGYSKLATFARYWAEDCDAGCFSCPSRVAECICDMVLFWKIAESFGKS